MSERPENCAGCGRPTQSHTIAIDVSEHDEIGLPTLAGVLCHRCWTGDTDDMPAVGHLYAGHRGDPHMTEESESRLMDALDFDYMVAVPAPVEELA